MSSALDSQPSVTAIFTFTCIISLPVRAMIVNCSTEDEQYGGIPGITNRQLQFLGLLNCAYRACERPNLPAVQVIFYMFCVPPRLLVAKLLGSLLLQFWTLFHKILGYQHQLAPLNAVSKLIRFLSPASHVPHLATPAPLTRACLNLCNVHSVTFVVNYNNNNADEKSENRMCSRWV